MKTENESYGELNAAGELRLVRLLPGPIERVWAYLIDPEKRSRWFAGGAMELRAGGKGELKFRHANLAPAGEAPPEAMREVHDPGVSFPITVTRCEPPRVLAFTWPEDDGSESEVSFELATEGDGVRLLLTHRRLPGKAQAANYGSGWHLHLGVLRTRLEDEPLGAFWAKLPALEGEYKRRFGVESKAAEGVVPVKPISVTVVRRFYATAERVYDAWLDPVWLGRWMFGSTVRDEEIVRLNLEARVGGEFSFVVRRQGKEFDHVGKYFELVRPRRLVFSWGMREDLPETSRVIVEIAPVAGGCALTLTHEMDPKWREYTERTQRGWTHMLEQLGRELGS